MFKIPTDYGVLIDTLHWKEYSSVYALLTLLSLIGNIIITFNIIITIVIIIVI